MNAIETLLDSLDHPLRGKIERLRDVIRQAEPSLVEHIKWNAPSFQAHGLDCVTLKLYPLRAVQVVFHRGTKTRDESDFRHLDATGLIKWATLDRGVAQFASLDEIEAKAEGLSDFVRRWVSAVSQTG